MLLVVRLVWMRLAAGMVMRGPLLLFGYFSDSFALSSCFPALLIAAARGIDNQSHRGAHNIRYLDVALRDNGRQIIAVQLLQVGDTEWFLFTSDCQDH